MPLFQKSVLNKYLNNLDTKLIENKYQQFTTHFLNPTIQENIRNSKEEQYQEGFLTDLFVNVLGYTKNPTPNYNLTTELKNIKDSKKVDGAIIINNVTKAVIELKGMNTTDLSTIENQAFGYKNNHPDCTYVITANFQKLRFYIDNAIEFIEFNLFTLTLEQFKELYLCLALENIEKDIPKRIKDESLTQEDTITKKLYKDYSTFKRELFDNLVQQNPEIDALTLFKKAQKLLDRFLFLFFAEDRGLLQPNSVRAIVNRWEKLKELDAYTPLIDSYRKYFGYLNTGHTSNDLIVYAYNGGLFAPDEVLDRVQLNDDVLKLHTLKIAQYDFASEIDVNILGHIFENSLNEIDEIQAELRGETIEKGKTKRKKDGVFYTPKYITKYIVDNTIGKLCTDKKTELQIIEADYYSDVVATKLTKKQKEEKKNLLDKLTTYRNWLLQLTICDPACGSGAFLNQALEFLITEHRYIDELQAGLFGDAMVLTDVEGSILENNLYGVDINEESVEIAKLSLWLRTAEPNRKLTSLSNNLKCGNSLISDPTVAGEKAFNWETEFPTVFAKGGFDVVIGNPPYVGTKQINATERNYYWKKYNEILFSEMDLYQLFLFKSIDNLLIKNGKLGFITPNSYFNNISFKKLRKYIFDSTEIKTIIDFPYRFYPFNDVNTETAIIILNKISENDNNIIELKSVDKKIQLQNFNLNNVYKNETYLKQLYVAQKYDYDIIINLNNILDKLLNLNRNFGYYLDLHKGWMSVPKSTKLTNRVINKGIFTYEQIKNDSDLKTICNTYLEGRDIHRYYTDDVDKYVSIDGIDKKTKEWHFCPKIILQRIVGQNRNKIFATVDFNNNVIFPNANLVNLRMKNDYIIFYLSILNSTLISYFYNLYFGESNTNLTKLAFESIPIPNIDEIDKKPFIEKADKMLNLNKDLKTNSLKFSKLLSSELGLTELSKKLQEWYNLEFADVLKELKKQKIELSLTQKSEWLEFFETEKQKVNNIQNQIQTTDKEIDQMVYALYELTPDEIEIVENS